MICYLCGEVYVGDANQPDYIRCDRCSDEQGVPRRIVK